MSGVQQALFPSSTPRQVVAGAPELIVPGGGFGCIAADPPWPYRDTVREELDYPTMTEAELERFAVRTLKTAASKDAHLWLWAVDAHLALALRMVELAGFTFVSSIPWVKTTKDTAPRVLTGDDLVAEAEVPRLRIGAGHYVRHAHELCLLAVRGSAVAEDRSVPSVIFAPPGRHSAKPEQLQDMAERVSPSPRAELFARRRRDGWTCWGNQVPAAPAPVDVEEPAAPEARPHSERPRCPECASPEFTLLGCIGDAERKVLRTSYACVECGHGWSLEKPRTDVCEHGRAVFVPCADCGRTWESIEGRKAS